MRLIPKEDLIEILNFSKQDILKLNSASIFLTGATGLFGTWFLSAIQFANENLNIDIKVTCLTRNKLKFSKSFPQLYSDKNFKFFNGDITSFDYPQGEFTHLIHFAATNAQETFDGASPRSKFDMIIDGSRRVIEFCKIKKIKKILFTSSGAVYGHDDSSSKNQFIEDLNFAPALSDISTALGQSKRAAEFLFQLHAHETKSSLTIMRCFSFVGPVLPLDIHYAIGNFIGNAIQGKSLRIIGDGTPIRSYMYMSDLITWLIRLLVNQASIDVINVGSDEKVNIKELAEKIIKVTNSKSNIDILGLREHSVGNPVKDIYVPNIEKAKTKYNLGVKVRLSESIKKTFMYNKNLSN